MSSLRDTCDLSGQITIQSIQQSHIEPLERRQVRYFARQRAKLVVGEVECLQVLHAEQLRRHLRQTHENKLKTMCELGNCKSSTHKDHIFVVLDAFLDDAFHRLAAKNQLSHCKQTKRHDAHNDSQHTVTASRANNTQTSSEIS